MGSIMFRIKCTVLAVMTAVPAAAGAPAAANPNHEGWQLFMRNRLDSAAAVFRANTGSGSAAVAGEAHRGLGQVAMFRGAVSECTSQFLKGWQKDGNTAALASGFTGLVYFRDQPDPESVPEGYGILTRLAGENGIFAGQFREVLLNRYLNDGALKKARRLSRETGAVTAWKMIGPFNNISDAGYGTAYPPETGIDFSTACPGKDGNLVRWRDIACRSLTGWIFAEDHCPEDDAVLYFYTCVKSGKERKARLAFGASGSFKVFFNGVPVLENPVFRNTGGDIFMQEVTLHRGDNPLLIKMCHEKAGGQAEHSRFSNFTVRFIDDSYRPLADLACEPTAALPAAAELPPADPCPSPLADTVTGRLHARLAADSSDIDAALLLMEFCNIMEMTDAEQLLARRYLRTYPGSAVWHKLYGESLQRARKSTDAQREIKTAYASSPLCYEGWSGELAMLTGSADARRVLEFLRQSPPEFSSRPGPLLAGINAKFQLEKNAEAVADLDVLARKHARSKEGMSVLASLSLQQGKAGKALEYIRDYLKGCRTDYEIYGSAAQVALQQGQFARAVKFYRESLEYQPDKPGIYYALADLHFTAKKYDTALAYLRQLFTVMPVHARGLLLKANIMALQNRPDSAQAAYREVIDYTRGDFAAWDNLFSLQGRPSLESLAPLPDVPGLVEESRNWEYRDSQNGTILDYTTDIFLYPSHCWRKRQFMVIYLPTQKAIDTWKERNLPYNGHFQTLSIARAVSYKADGTRIPADISGNKVVYKSLEPGDYTVLEYSLDNYYTGVMADKVWGRNIFDSTYPVYRDMVRLVTPAADTIPYTVTGDSVAVTADTAAGYRITSISHPPYRHQARETFMMTDWPGHAQVQYGTLESWREIADWYDDLTRRKQQTSLELQALADSLFPAGLPVRERVRRMHDYICGAIRYSSVSFRQSGWVPQAAADVLATKIGDCKDMACLGKSLLDLAGIPSSLVLVNTSMRHYTGNQRVSPDFNHCILVARLDDGDLYIDPTDNNLAPGPLPKADQAAMALVIRRGNDSLITLPMDTPSTRTLTRNIALTVGTDGTVTGKITTRGTGWYARTIRGNYRFLPEEERTAKLHKSLSATFPGMETGATVMHGLQALGDTAGYSVSFTAPAMVPLSGRTAILPVRTPDRIEAQAFPVEENRRSPVDMHQAWYDIATLTTAVTVTFPAGWQPLSLPENVTFESPFGTFALNAAAAGNVITMTRRAVFDFSRPVPLEEYGALGGFMNRIVRADNIQIVFTVP